MQLSNYSKKTPEEVAALLEEGFTALTEDEEFNQSLLLKYLTREVLDEYKEVFTEPPIEASLLDCVQSGFEHHNSVIGIYAADENCYEVYEKLFDPLIRDYHGQEEGDNPQLQKDVDWGDIDEIENMDPERKYIITTRIRVARNIEGFPLFPKMKEKDYQEVADQVFVAAAALEGEHTGACFNLDDLSEETQKEMVNRHMLFKRGDEFLTSAGCYRFWPTGRAIFHNPAETFLIWINESDHLRIISIAKCGDLGK